MKLEKVKRLTQKIIISVVILLMTSAIAMPVINFAVDTGTRSTAGTKVAGMLLDPIKEFLEVIADGTNWISSEIVGAGGNVSLTTEQEKFNYVYSKTDDSDLIHETLKIEEDIDEDPSIPDIQVTPLQIFSGKIALLDTNFFGTTDETTYNANHIGGVSNSAVWNLRNIIKNWYQAFRLIALVGLLTVLVYLGIRIVISSAAEEQAKYKERLIDWLVALCLVFFLHYIMAFTTFVTSEVQDAIVKSDKEYTHYVSIVKKNGEPETIKGQTMITYEDIKNNPALKGLAVLYILNHDLVTGAGWADTTANAIQEYTSTLSWGNALFPNIKGGLNALKSVILNNPIAHLGALSTANLMDWAQGISTATNGDEVIAQILNDNNHLNGYLKFVKNKIPNGEEILEQCGLNVSDDINESYPTNLTGLMKLKANNPNGMQKIAYTIMYLALSFYTIYFLWIYAKRLLKLTFLTVIAPLVALTYPIDKVKDGKAQAFNYWLREYLINSMLPIMHLILYTVFVTSAMELATTMPIYAIFALAFIVPAEKIVRSMFGIKSELAPPPGGFATGALAVTALNGLRKRIGSATKGIGKGEKDSKTEKDKIRYKDEDKVDYEDLIDGEGKENIRTNGAPLIGQSGIEKSNRKPAINNGEVTTPAGLIIGADVARRNGLTNNLDGVINANRMARAASTPNLSAAKKKISARRTMINNANRLLHNRYKLPYGAKALSKELGKRALKGSLKLGVRAATTVTGASIGLAAGIVSGDMKDLWKGAAGGAAAGLVIGGIADKPIDNAGKELEYISEQLKYGEEEGNRVAARKQHISDYKNRQYMIDKYQEKWEEEAKQNNTKLDIEKMVDQYLEETSKYLGTGETEIKELDKMRKYEEKLIQEKKEYNKRLQKTKQKAEEEIRKEAIRKVKATAKFNKQFGNAIFTSDKKRRETVNRLAEIYETSGYSKEQAKKLASRSIDEIEEYNKD